jgi:threonine dehydrogenase-like Zn-dependent dehydrogenase
VKLVERPTPSLKKSSEVLLRTLEVGVCGTDREICAFEYGAPPPGERDLVLGHEALAEVVEVGPDVTWARPGDLAVPTVRRPCPNPRCPACRACRPDFCTTGEFSERGIVRAHGFLCEAFVEEERFLVPVPHAIRDVAVLVEPLSVAAKAAQEFESIRDRYKFDLPRPTALVLGAGPIGLLAAMTMRTYGIETRVFSRETEDDPRAALTCAIGATYISAERIPLERLPECVGRHDLVFEAVGVPEVAFGALPALAPNGIFIKSGVPARRGPVAADLSRWMYDLVLNNQVIVGTVNAGRSAYELAIRVLEQCMTLFPDAVRSLLRRGPLEMAREMLLQSHGIKDVVTVDARIKDLASVDAGFGRWMGEVVSA